MGYRIAIAVSVGVLTFALTGCAEHGKVASTLPRTGKTAVSPAPSSQDGRTVLRISSENTEADSAELERLKKENTEVAGLIERLKSDPNDLDAMRHLADAYMHASLYASAFQVYQQLRIEAPSDAAADIGLARIWNEYNDYSQALDHADRAVSLDPTSVDALETRGRIHLHRNEAGPALASYAAALALSPGNPSLLTNAGYACILQEDWERARLYLERAVDTEGVPVQAYNNLGIVLAHLGEPEAALEHFMAADSPAAAHNNLGVVHVSEGRWHEAESEFKAALAIDPSYTLAAENLKEAEAHVQSKVVDSILPPAPIRKKENVFAVQIFSTQDGDEAKARIDRFVERAGMQAVVVSIDLGDKGTWFRGRINGFESYDSAMQMAKDLLAEGLISEFWIVPSDE